MKQYTILVPDEIADGDNRRISASVHTDMELAKLVNEVCRYGEVFSVITLSTGSYCVDVRQADGIEVSYYSKPNKE